MTFKNKSQKAITVNCSLNRKTIFFVNKTKPSERVPGAGQRLVELMLEAGLPAGCLNVVHGTHDCVNFICDNKHINYGLK